MEAARTYADTGIEQLWSGKLFVRQPSDPYYEAKMSTNAFVAGLLRLHMIENNETGTAGILHWSM